MFRGSTCLMGERKLVCTLCSQTWNFAITQVVFWNVLEPGRMITMDIQRKFDCVWVSDRAWREMRAHTFDELSR